MKRRWARFWYRFKNWFRTKPGPGKPLTFLCGSQEELRRVTRWMCQATPSLFRQECVIVNYLAVDAGTGGYFQFDGHFQHSLSPGEKSYLYRGCTLILEHNRFIGTIWLHDLSTHSLPPKTLFGYFEWPLDIAVTVVYPSLSEQVASRLAFAEWLGSKVGEEARRELLQLPDDVEG